MRNPSVRRTDRGFTLVELLVVIAIISVIAGFLIPTLMKARGRADEVSCQNNLRELQRLGMLFADIPGNRFYPIGHGQNPPAHESLNVLITANHGTLKPALFVCRTWRGDPAVADADNNFQLEEENCSYTWPKKKVSPSDPSNTALSCDKYVRTPDQNQGHEGGREVVFLDSSVDFWNVEKLDAESIPKGLTR